MVASAVYRSQNGVLHFNAVNGGGVIPISHPVDDMADYANTICKVLDNWNTVEVVGTVYVDNPAVLPCELR